MKDGDNEVLGAMVVGWEEEKERESERENCGAVRGAVTEGGGEWKGAEEWGLRLEKRVVGRRRKDWRVGVWSERNRKGRREKMENGEDENGEELSVLGLVRESQNEEGKP